MRTAKAKAKLALVQPCPAETREAKTDSHHEFASKYQIIFDQASDAILAIRPDGKIDAMNVAAENMTGYLRSELEQESVRMLVPDQGQSHVPERARPLNISFFRKPGTYEDVAIVRKDGYIRLVDLTVREVSGEGTKLALALLRDLTEKKQTERELITKHTELRNAYFQLETRNAELKSMQETLVQAGKMAALGELAAGIAHEINQPLQGIRGYAQELGALTSAQSANPDVATCVKEIVSNCDKMAGIIDYLRTFVRKSVEKHEFTEIHHAIDEAFKMLSRQFASRGIAVEKEYAADLPKLYANPLQLEQVFINLATNARDAIDETKRGSGKIRVSTKKSGEFIEVSFQDDGAGMSERTKAKAFNPFFTTKEVGKGMGLGLSLSYGVISKLHGSIVVQSALGKGTTFLIRLPRDFRELA